jgi:Holliday junction resolvase
MTSFTTRLTVGEEHEQRVQRELEERGWTVARWGQGILPKPVRRAIQEGGSRFRHFPDLIAARPGGLVVIDAKDRMHSSETGRYAVARECVSFGLQFTAAFSLPVYYVFGNLAVFTPAELMSYGSPGPRSTGSGAYYLMPERLGRHFDDVFGRPEHGEAAA